MLLIVFNVLVEVVVISFLGRGDNKAFYGQQCVLTETVLLKIKSLLCVRGDGALCSAL